MVILKNIKMENDSISAEYYPEGRGEKGFMKISLLDKSVIEHDQASMFAAPHVKNELLKISKHKKLPQEKTVMWY